ncbi:MAG: YqiA/YcfP family alpha/beta fold hydrolase [Prevotella sp.]
MIKSTQENPSFPGLFSGKKIMYVHGFGSSAQSGTVALLRNLLPEATVVARDIPVVPEEAMEMLRQMCREEQPDLIVGTSMGGMYAEQLRGYDRILVNPAFRMGETMGSHGMTGKQTFQNRRADGIQEFIVTKALVKAYEEATQQCFRDITPEERGRVVGMFGDKDPLVDTFSLFREHYPTAIRFHGEHRLTDKVALHYLIPVIRWIDDRQEQRERPVVFIDLRTMADSYGHAASSMNKAYEMLIENYNVYIIAAAPTNDHQAISDAQEWVEEYISAPAYDRIVFTNQPQLLLGDYLIAPHTPKGFMGTTLEFGSQTFKCWEDIIPYFERLGGQ